MRNISKKSKGAEYGNMAMTHSYTWSFKVQVALTLVAIAAYILSFVALDTVLANQAGILSTVPVVVAAWLFGLRVSCSQVCWRFC